MSRLHRRLDKIEAARPAQRGIKVFYCEGDHYTQAGAPYTRADLDRFGAEGWIVLIVQYEQAQAAQA